MNGTIYMLTNMINGKRYIGQTRQSVATRISDHKRNNYNNSLIAKAIRKYGLDNFEVKILDTNINTQEQLNELEIVYIAAYKSQLPNGYNMSNGGEGANKFDKLSKETQSIIIQEYTNGESLSSLGKRYGVDHHTIGKYVRKANVVVRSRFLPNDIESKVLELRSQNMFNKDIAKQLNISKSTVEKIFNKHGLKSIYYDTSIPNRPKRRSKHNK